MNDEDTGLKPFNVLPVEAFLGAGGHVVILQEWPELSGDTFVRVFIAPKDAERVCAEIMAAARKAQK